MVIVKFSQVKSKKNMILPKYMLTDRLTSGLIDCNFNKLNSVFVYEQIQVSYSREVAKSTGKYQNKIMYFICP